jgi:hypothetical protein
VPAAGEPRWVTLRARWVTFRARSLGDAKSSLGDAKSSLDDAESSLGDAKSSLDDAKISLGDVQVAASGRRPSLDDAPRYPATPTADSTAAVPERSPFQPEWEVYAPVPR